MPSLQLFANKKYFKPSGFESSTHGEDYELARTATEPLKSEKDNSHNEGLHVSA